MSTKQQTTTTNAYNNAAMGTYNMFQGAIGNNLMQMVNNPLGNSFFKNQLAQQMGVSNQIGQRNNSNALRNMRTGGGVLSNAGGFAAGMLNRNNLTNSMMQGNAFNTALNSALQSRNTGLMSMQAYQPLQTGQNSTQTTSGLGTWLPQLAGAALSAAMPGIGSMMGGGSFASGYKSGGGGGYSPASGGGGSMASYAGSISTPNMFMQNNYPGAGLPAFRY